MKNTKITILISLTVLLLCGIPTISTANELIFEGTLNDAEGRPVADGSHFFDFTIFTAPAGGTTLWAESHDNVNTEQGYYSIILGSRTALDLPAGTYWVETTVDGEVLQPRAKVLLADGDCTITNNLMVDGRIGVGTATPGYPIHIDQGNVASGFRTYYGSTCATCYGEFKQAQADGLIINSSTGGGTFAEIRFQNNSVTNMFLRSNGNLGIGTDIPDTKLEVWGSARFGDRSTSPGTSGSIVDIHNPAGTGSSILVTSYSFTPETQFIVEGGGDVGIGIDNPTHLLHLDGGAYCDGGAWVNGSSRSFKENITDLTSEEALDTLADLNPTSFNYKTDSEETYLGFIAEDVPDLVATNDRKGLVAMDIVAVLTKVVQTQQEQIRILEESIEALHATPVN